MFGPRLYRIVTTCLTVGALACVLAAAATAEQRAATPSICRTGGIIHELESETKELPGAPNPRRRGGFGGLAAASRAGGSAAPAESTRPAVGVRTERLLPRLHPPA